MNEEAILAVCQHFLTQRATHNRQISDKMQMFNFMRGMAANLCDTDKLASSAFSIHGWKGFSKKELREKRDRYVAVIKAEMAEFETRRNVWLLSVRYGVNLTRE